MKIAYVCVHNSCRSQMAEALTKHLFPELEVYSAGTQLVSSINKDAVRLMKQRFNIDMKNQHSKLVTDIPEVDIVVTMGCNVDCPFIKCSHKEDWGLDDPSGKSDEQFNKTIDLIYSKVLNIKERIDGANL